MYRLVIVVGVALLSCAPKRIEAEPPTPIATRLAPPDGGPFDFSHPPKEEEPPPVSGEMRHLRTVPGQPAPR